MAFSGVLSFKVFHLDGQWSSLPLRLVLQLFLVCGVVSTSRVFVRCWRFLPLSPVPYKCISCVSLVLLLFYYPQFFFSSTEIHVSVSLVPGFSVGVGGSL